MKTLRECRLLTFVNKRGGGKICGFRNFAVEKVAPAYGVSVGSWKEGIR